MNETLRIIATQILKDLLSKCTSEQHSQFKRMYCYKNQDLPINEAVDEMSKNKIDWAITQCEIMVSLNNIKQKACLHPVKQTFLIDGLWSCTLCGCKWGSSEFEYITPKPTRGGARIGAGSKPKYDEPTMTIAFRCPISKVDEVKELVKKVLNKFKIW